MTTRGIKVQDDAAMKAMLHRIVAMDSGGDEIRWRRRSCAQRMMLTFDYDYEHRCAEHEHDSLTGEAPELWDAR